MNALIIAVSYKANSSTDAVTYYYAHNWRGDITSIYDGDGNMVAKYEYDVWGNVLTVTDANNKSITDKNHIANLNPFRYRSYYYDSKSGLYYLMSRYYDPVAHRFLNAGGYFQSGDNILDTNMNAYCQNNPIMNSDPTGESCRKHACYYVGSCEACNPDLYRLRRSRPGFVAKAYSAGSKKGGDWKPRKDSRKGSENRQPTGARERNKAHPNGEEHSRVPKGNGLKRYDPITLEKILATEVIIISAVFIVYLVANDVTGVGVIDDAAIIPVAIIIWEAAQAFA